MPGDGYSEKYVTLAEYAAGRGITVGYLRGVIYYLDLRLPVVSGGQVVDESARAKLDPIVGKIKSAMSRDGRIRPGRRSSRQAAPA